MCQLGITQDLKLAFSLAETRSRGMPRTLLDSLIPQSHPGHKSKQGQHNAQTKMLPTFVWFEYQNVPCTTNPWLFLIRVFFFRVDLRGDNAAIPHLKRNGF